MFKYILNFIEIQFQDKVIAMLICLKFDNNSLALGFGAIATYKYRARSCV